MAEKLKDVCTGGEQDQLKFYVLIGLDVRLPEVVLIFSMIAVPGFRVK